MQRGMLDVNVPSVFTYQPASQELQSTTFSVHQCIKSPFHFLPDDEKENHNILSPRSFRIDNTPNYTQKERFLAVFSGIRPCNGMSTYEMMWTSHGGEAIVTTSLPFAYSMLATA